MLRKNDPEKRKKYIYYAMLLAVLVIVPVGYGIYQVTLPKPPLTISWVAGAAFPDLIKGGAMGVVDSYVIYVGGISYPWRERETGWYLDPQANDWKPLPPMPEGRAYTSGVTVENALYVIGGRKAGAACRSTFRLTRVNSSWRWDVLPEMQQGRAAATLAAVDNVIYAIGGGIFGSGGFFPDSVTIDEYLDLNNLTAGWRQMPTCPGPRRADAMSTTVDGKIYVFGGYRIWLESGERQGLRLYDAYVFDPKEWKWSEVARLPNNGMSGGAAVTFRDRYIILLGGAIPEQQDSLGALATYQDDSTRGVRVGYYNKRVFVYDVKTNTYSELYEALPYATHDIKAVIVGNIIYAVGGETIDSSISNTDNHVREGMVSTL